MDNYEQFMEQAKYCLDLLDRMQHEQEQLVEKLKFIAQGTRILLAERKAIPADETEATVDNIIGVGDEKEKHD